MTPLNNAGCVGAVIRYVSPDEWTAVACETLVDMWGRGVWVWRTADGRTGKLYTHAPRMFTGKPYRIKIRYEGGIVTVSVGGYKSFRVHVPELADAKPGQAGFIAWRGGEFEYKIGDGHGRFERIAYHSGITRIAEASPIHSNRTIELSSSMLDVTLDAAFPRVEAYRWKSNGARLFGQEVKRSDVELNGEPYKPEVVLRAASETMAEYVLSIHQLETEMTVVFKLEQNVLHMRITRIRENGSFRVYTVEFPGHSLVSCRSIQTGAHLSSCESVYRDEFVPLADKAADLAERNRGIAILNTDALAASIDTNAIMNRKQHAVQTVDCGAYRSTGLWSSYWTYRRPDGVLLELPWAKVVVTGDRNGDGIVDWQDGAIALRDVIPAIPGAQQLRQSYAHIVMNFASLAQYPFLRILDNVKKLYLYTDGFGQMIELKGYQSEGHDSGHPDYGKINERAGGTRDLNVLVDRARQYNTVIGVHINQTETYPEARAYEEAIISDIDGWRWLDQSVHIDREADMLSGRFAARLDELKAKVPKLGFVYVDTYRDDHWTAYELVRHLRERDFAIWTEDADSLDRDSMWQHDSSGDSRISRFVHHHQKDAYEHDSLLRGGYPRYGDNGFMGWQKEKDLYAVVQSFYTKQLPYRYLMHFPLSKWTEHEAQFAGGVVSKMEDGVAKIYRHGRKIAKGDTIFIPWDPHREDKVYHWNPEGGRSEWELPASWSGLEQVKLYRLTATGRQFIQDIPVTGNIVGVEAEARKAYVIYKTEAPVQHDMQWGEGGLVRDPGFNSHGFQAWSRSSTHSDCDHIQIRATEYGQSYLSIAGNGGAEGVVSQKLKGLEAGKTYAASVWAEVSKGRKAVIGVCGYGGPGVSSSTDRTEVLNCSVDSDKRGTYYERLRILFEVPQTFDRTAGEPLLILKAEEGTTDSYVNFDDVRVREVEPPTEHNHWFFENFEHVDEGWWPFVSAGMRIGRTHLSERHEGYTDDTIEGRWSLKTMDEQAGEVYRTLPSTIKLEPNTRYRFAFDYKAERNGQYAIVVRTTKGGLQEEKLNVALQAGLNRFTAEAATGDYGDYYIAIVKNNGDRGSLVIDNFAIDLA